MPEKFDIEAKKKELEIVIADWLAWKISCCSLESLKGKLGETLFLSDAQHLLRAISPLAGIVDWEAELPEVKTDGRNDIKRLGWHPAYRIDEEEGETQS